MYQESQYTSDISDTHLHVRNIESEMSWVRSVW